jgi:hypothetical protein
MEKKYFTITTNLQTAEQIIRQCKWDERFGDTRSYKLGQVRHEKDYSVVQIIAKNELIKPEDLFWLGHHSRGIEIESNT